MADGERPDNTPSGQTVKPYDQSLADANSIWIRQDAAANSIDGKRTLQEGAAIGGDGVSSTTVAEAIRELTSVLRDALVAIGKGGGGEAGGQADGEKAGTKKPGLFEKIFDAKGRVRDDIQDQVDKGDLSEDELEAALHMWRGRMTRGDIAKIGKVRAAILAAKRAARKAEEERRKNPFEKVEDEDDDADGMEPFEIAVEPNVGEWVDAFEWRRQEESRWTGQSPYIHSGKTPQTMENATTGTDIGSDMVGTMVIFRDEMRRFNNTLISVLEGMVTDHRNAHARLEEIERYFKQLRETL